MSGAWINGRFGSAIDPFDRAVTLGDGVFDTTVAFRGVPFAADRHLARLLGHAEAIGIVLEADAVQAGWRAVLERAGEDGVILRTTVSRGPAGRGLWPKDARNPTIMVTSAAWNPQLSGARATLATAPVPRNERSPLSRLKSLNYLDNILAARHASSRGASDALLLNTAGNVACTTIANVFAVLGDELVTPPAEDGVLPGVIRGLVLEAAQAAGLRPAERSFLPKEFASADAAFLTNSVRFVAPVESLDGSLLRDPAHPAVRAVAELLTDEVTRQCGADVRPVLHAHPAAAGRR